MPATSATFVVTSVAAWIAVEFAELVSDSVDVSVVAIIAEAVVAVVGAVHDVPLPGVVDSAGEVVTTAVVDSAVLAEAGSLAEVLGSVSDSTS
jgi:hypothetical protein